MPELLVAVAKAFGTETVAVTLHGAEQTEAWVVASNPLARLAQDLEYTLGEGPAREVTESRHEIVASGPGLCERWLHYGPAVGRMGIRAVAAAPLLGSAEPLGALTVFDPGDAGAAAPAAVVVALRMVAQRLVDGLVDAGPAGSLINRGDHRAQVHQAAGIVSVQYGCQVGEALVLLRAYAFTHGEAIGSVADRVVRRELRLDAS